MPPISIRNIDDLKDRLRRARESIDYNISPKPLTDPPPVGVEQPLEKEKEKDFSSYAEIASQSYEENRKDINSYNYIQELSTSNYAVYESPEEYILGIRGSSPEEPTRDFIRDTQVALGSLSTLTGANFVGKAINEVDELVKKLKDKNNKKISITGHSLGGSIASFFGIDNPDVSVYTFNKGEGLPFITDLIKCGISGCRNIKNYRIAGDFASLGSKLGNIGTYKTLRPVRPTPEVIEESQLAGGFFIEPELYLPHSVSNFIGRDNKQKLNSNIYARPLASKIGKISGLAIPMIGGIAYNKYLESLGENQLEQFLNLPSGTVGQRIIDYMGERGLETPQTSIQATEIITKNLFSESVTPFKNSLTSVATSGLAGRSVGELGALAFYEAFLKE